MMQTLRLRMKMKQSQYKELLSKIGEVLSVLPYTIPVADKDLMESQIFDKKHQIEYDSASHGAQVGATLELRARSEHHPSRMP